MALDAATAALRALIFADKHVPLRLVFVDVVRIKCAVCEDFDLCVECFAQGVELGEHRSDHAYCVVDTLNFPVMTMDWGADEELALLDGIKMYGMGNWEDIAEHIGTKTKLEVEEHYLQTYINCPTYPLPNFSKTFTQEEVAEFRQKRHEREKILQQERRAGDKPAKPPQITSQPACHEVAGFMPFRQEFDVEHDNDAEVIVSQLSFNEEDTPEDIELKLKVLAIYNSKLDVRKRRRDFILDRQLTNLKQQMTADKRRKDFKDSLNQNRALAMLQSGSDFELFVDGLINEQRIRAQIAQLQEWRRAGVTTLAGGEQYEADKKKRTPELLRRAREAVAFSATKARIRDDSFTPFQKQRRHGPLDLSNAEDVQLLSPKEYELCSVLRIMPRAYLTMKDNMIRECNYLGCLKRSQARRMFRIDVNKTGKVYDFFIAAGWIRAEPLAGHPTANAISGALIGTSSSSSAVAASSSSAASKGPII